MFRRQPQWAKLIQYVWIAVLFATCFFLGQRMVSHKFFSGGAMDNGLARLVY